MSERLRNKELENIQVHVGDLIAGRYLLEGKVGAGGMGIVYMAKDLKLPGKKRAVKVLLGHLSTEEQQLEAELLMKLEHPLLPQLVDYYPSSEYGHSIVVTDFIDGATLDQKLVKGVGMARELVLHIGIQLAQVLQYLHSRQPNPIIYRDMKPSNVMLDDQGIVRLIDFGIARKYERLQSGDTMPLGTIGFAAPEQYQGCQTNALTDLYSLGALLYYLLTGGKYVIDAQHARSTLRNMQAHAANVDPLHTTVLRLLEEKPENRFASAREFLQEMQRLQAVSEYKASPSDQEQDSHISADGIDPATGQSVKRQLVVVGAIVQGSGASFIAGAIARILNAYHVRHAMIEWPGQRPEWYWRLDGERCAPFEYRFLMDTLFEEHRGRKKHWRSGHTEWFPLPPYQKWRNDQEYPEHMSFKLLYEMEQKLMIVDVGDRWLDRSVRQLCQMADCIIAVHEPCPYKLASEQAYAHMNELARWRQKGATIHFVGNKHASIDTQQQWLGTFPWKTECVVPAYDYSVVQGCAWQGKLMQDEPAVLASLLQTLGQSVQRYCKVSDEERSRAASHQEAVRQMRRSLWLKWRKKHKNKENT